MTLDDVQTMANCQWYSTAWWPAVGRKGHTATLLIRDRCREPHKQYSNDWSQIRPVKRILQHKGKWH
eukprot:4743299-Amphidinium_carterae.1